MSGPRPIRTVTEDDRTAFHRAETRVRVTGVVVMGLIVVAALTGFLGPRESTHTMDGAAGTLEVTHPQLTRPGLDAEIVVVVDPLSTGEPLRLRVDSEVLSTLGILTVQPAPEAERSADGAVEYEFVPTDEPPYEIRFSGRVPTKAPPTRLSWDMIWLSGTGDAITLTETTWVLP